MIESIGLKGEHGMNHSLARFYKPNIVKWALNSWP
ncbi:MAG: DUF4442 domain-containing protein, partial [Vibrio sp.]|nr:DUF4442 domain-containing protein [Vibrio sp.]